MKKREVLKYRLKNEQECILRFKITVFKPEHDCEFFVNGFKISDIDQFILTLIFRFEVILVDVNFSRVFIRYKDTH